MRTMTKHVFLGQFGGLCRVALVGIVAGRLLVAASAALGGPRLQLHFTSSVGYWPLDEAEGDVAHDRSGQAGHGAIVDAEWTDASPADAGHALRFDGETAYVKISGDRQIIPRTDDWTVMAWLNISGDGTADTFLQAGLGADQRHRALFYHRDGELRLWSPGSGNVVATAGIAGDGWRHVITDYESQGKVVYPSKLLFDADGHPVILYITSFGASPSPKNDPREWKITRWTGQRWVTTRVTTSDHNYDMGSLYLDGDQWTLIAPALSGPQPYFSGGEVGVWSTDDPDREGWPLKRRVTRDSPFNHCYLRRPHNPVDPFFAMWADSDSSQSSLSRLYFTNSTGERLYKLPYKMDSEYAEPRLLDPPVPPPPEETWPDETPE